MKALLAKAAVLKAVPKDWVIAALIGLLIGVGGWMALGKVGLTGGGGDASDVKFTGAELDRARRDTYHAASALGDYLGYGPNGRGWRKYLSFDDLQLALSRTDPATETDEQVLSHVLNQLSQEYPGLERREFASVRTTLSTYLKMRRLADPPDTEQIAAGERNRLR